MENSLTKKKKNRFGLTASTVKILAVIFMTLDHIAWTIVDRQLRIRGLESYPIIANKYFLRAYDTLYGLSYSFHIIGRLAFPLFVFFVVEGVHHTSNIRKYASTMIIFAILSEIPFNLIYAGKFFCLKGQNVMFTLFFCIIAVYALMNYRDKWYIALPITAACALGAYFMKVDYGYPAVIFACIVELLYDKKILGYCLGCIVMAALGKPWELCCLLAAPLVGLYNGKRGLKLKYAFYIYYPLHFLIIFALTKIY